MKTHHHLVATLLLATFTGCSKPKTRTSNPSHAPVNQTAALSLDISTDAPSSSAEIQPVQETVATAKLAGRPELLKDFDQISNRRDHMEKVANRWNNALGKFSKKHGRQPKTLPELQQFQPDLASLNPPSGFQLQLDPGAGEVYLIPTSTRSQQ